MVNKLKSGIQQWQENQGEVEWRQDEWANWTPQCEVAYSYGDVATSYQEAGENRWEAIPLSEKWMVNTIKGSVMGAQLHPMDSPK
jgi:hypothetical protein